MANNTNNIRSSTTITTNSRPNNGPLPSSGLHSSQKDNRDLLHPKVKNFIYKFNFLSILFLEISNFSTIRCSWYDTR